MRIAYVYDAVYPWEPGGVQKRVWEVSRRLATDHDVHWYGLKYWDGPATIQREGLTLHGVLDPPELYVNGRRSITEALSFAGLLGRPLMGERFDVVDVQEFPYFPTFTAKLRSLTCDARLVMTWHEIWDDYWYEYMGWKGAVGRAVERACLRLPDAHVAVSETTAEDLTGLGTPPDRTIPNGIAMDAIDEADPAGNDVDVLFVGRLIKEKNPAMVLEAVDRIREDDPDVRCCFVGDGPERDRIERLVVDRNLGSNVTVLDPRDSYADVLGLMKAADVFALPSRREGFSITVLEAMACGTPIVTVEHPQNSATDLIDGDGTGIVTECTPEALARGIDEVRANGSKRACVSTASEYDWDAIAEETDEFYRSIV